MSHNINRVRGKPRRLCDNLIKAVKCQNMTGIMRLKKNKEMLRLTDNNGWTPFHHAACAGDKQTLEMLFKGVERKADYANLLTWRKETPLMIAAKSTKADVDVLELFISAGSDIHAKNDVHQTALMYACEVKGALPQVMCLIRHGANVNDQDDLNGFTPLHSAIADARDVEMTRYLATISDLAACNAGGEDALLMAITVLPEVAQDFVESEKQLLSGEHLKRAAILSNWDLFRRLIIAGASLHVYWGTIAHNIVLPFHFAWDKPEILKTVLPLVPISAYNEHAELVGITMEQWLELADVNTESLEIYLQHTASIGHNDICERWQHPIVQKYFSPPTGYKLRSTNSPRSLREYCRVPARLFIRSFCKHDWEAFCWLENAVLPQVLKSFLLCNNNNIW